MYLSKRWKTPRLVLAMFAVEFAGTVASLALFGIASPDLYRTGLWKDGGLNGFNSDPDEILYAYANYRPIPKIPLVWSQIITDYNLVISVLSMFILLAKAVMWIMHIWWPILSLVMHVCLTVIWAVSVYGQASPDYSDPNHPSRIPWYLTKSCSVAAQLPDVHYCELAKGTFAITVIMLAVFACHIPISLYSLLPGRQGRHSRHGSDDSDIGMQKMPRDSVSSPAVQHFPPPPKTPITPRTVAFNKLSNALPLRSHPRP